MKGIIIVFSALETCVSTMLIMYLCPHEDTMLGKGTGHSSLKKKIMQDEI